MTAVELLVVVLVIGALANFFLPGLGGKPRRSKIVAAKVDMSNIIGAIETYYTDYQQLPVSTNVTETHVNGINVGPQDFTFGTTGPRGVGVLTNAEGTRLPLIRSMYDNWKSPPYQSTPYDYQANNSELMAVLTSVDRFFNGAQSINTNYQYNPRRNIYLNAKNSAGVAPGIGPDGVFRDPWGNPYIVSISVGRSGRVKDAVYSLASVSEDYPSKSESPNGLFSTLRGPPLPKEFPNTNFPGYLHSRGDRPSDRNGFTVGGNAIAWCFGPDGKVSSNERADAGVNKDNVHSWR
jgi:type II secretory pathway pseudopilin PulG